MRLLLDTHALLWWWLDDPQLSATARRLIGDEANRVFASAASAWEIATKHRLGRLGLPALTLDRYESLLTEDGFEALAVTVRHALIAGSDPQPHGDPFDRMLAAQARVEGLTLVSRDPLLAEFGVEIVW